MWLFGQKNGLAICKNRLGEVQKPTWSTSDPRFGPDFAKCGFGLMHKLFWLCAQILHCLANEVLPLEGGKLVFYRIFAPKNGLAHCKKLLG